MPDNKPVNLGGVIEGFPKTPIIDTNDVGILGKDISINDMFSNLLSSPKSSGAKNIPLSSFYIGDRYTETRPNTDYEEMAAQQQGTLPKWGNAIVKMGGTASTSFVAGTAGLIYGLGKSIYDQKFSSLYNNEVTQKMDSFSKQLEDALPNYYKHSEQDAEWYSPKNILTANFWSDKVLKNMGYSIGAIGGGVIWASALRGIGLTNALVRAGASLEMVEATEAAMNAAPKGQKYSAFQNALNSVAQKYVKSPAASILKSSDRIIASAMGTFGEASMESLQNLNQFRNDLIQKYKEKNGFDPKGSDLYEINEYADKVGNFSWGFNTLLLTATNYIQLPKILGSSRKADKSLIGAIEQDVTKPIGEQFVKPKVSLLQNVAGLSGLGFSPSEAFEEGTQYSIQVGTQDYFNRAYTNKEDISSFFSNLNSAFKGTISEGVDKTLSSKEGIENIIIGGISGGLQQLRGTIKEQGFLGGGGEIGRNTDLALSALNNPKSNIKKVLKDGVDYIARGINSQSLRQESISRNDVLSEKDYEHDYALSYILPRVKYGKIESLNEEVDYYLKQSLNEEGFQELKNEGIIAQNETREQFIQRVNSIKSTAKSVDELYSQINDKYSSLVNKEGERVYSPEIVDRMVYAASKVADYDKRIPQLSNNLAIKGIITNYVINDVTKGKSEEYNKVVDQILDLDINDDKKEDLLRDLNDVSELTLRRQLFLKEYNDIKKAPENFKSTEIPTKVPGEPSEKIVVKTKDGEEEVEVGEEYFLGKTVEYDASGKEIYRFPRITILGENEDGTIKVRDGKGNVKNVSKSVLEDYKLGKVSDTLTNKKAKFYMDNINSIFEFNFGKGKKKRGRLEYSSKDKVLNFVYKDDKGRLKNIEVTSNQFAPKQGFVHPIISRVGEITASQKQSLSEFASEKDDRITAKREARLKILNDLFDDVTSTHEKVKKLISQKQSELGNITKELTSLEDKIKTAEFTPKRGNFKSITRKALQAAMRLSRMKEQLEDEIKSLETERDETEFNASYISDLSQNIDELPTDTKDFLEELKDQRNTLESLILETGKEINTISNLVDKVKDALNTAVDFVKDLLSKFETKYPKVPLAIGQEWVDFLKLNPNFLKYKPDYREELKQVEDLVAQVEDLDIIPNERSLGELTTKLTELQSALENVEKELKAKDVILSKFQDVADKYAQQKEQEQKLEKNKKLQKEILGSADPGVQTVNSDNNYESQSKKTNISVVTSTKTAGKSTLPHHIRANRFGANLEKFPNKEKIKGVIVTSKNEELIGLKGLTSFLKGDSDVDASKIIALVIVEDGKPVGEDGKIIEFSTSEVSSFVDNIIKGVPQNTSEELQFYENNKKQIEDELLNRQKGQDILSKAIFQVMPDPKLEWSKEFGGGTMFRKDTTPEQIEYYKNQYTEWVNQTLESPTLSTYDISASFGIPEYVTYLDEKGNQKRDYNAKTSVEDAGLITSANLTEQPLIFVPVTDTVLEKGSVSFNTPLGRPFLSLPNGYVKLDNRKLTKEEANTIYQAIHELSNDILENQDAKSEKATRLIKWLKSIIYWGSPKNAAGFNSVWFNTIDGQFSLSISGQGKTYPFTPSSISLNKGEIITLLEGMYNNVNSGLTDKPNLWNATYEEILSIKDGVIESKQWPNYQTYLLSQEGRKPEELPLSTNLKPIREGETNRQGIYFTLAMDADRYTNPPVKPIIAPKESGKLDVNAKRKEVKIAIQKAGQGEGGQFYVTLLDGTKEGAVRIGLVGNELQVKNGSVDLSVIRKIENPDGTVIYNSELPKEAPDNIFILDGETINTFTSPKGKKIKFFSGTTPDSVRIAKGGDLEEMLKALTASLGDEQLAKREIENRVKQAIIAQSPNPSSTEEFGTEEVEKEPTEAPAKSIFGKEKPSITPINKVKIKGPNAEAMEFFVDDLDEEEALRVKLDRSVKAFEPENWEETQKWLKANFPNIPVYRVKNIIQATNGQQAWGMLKNGAIYVYENAEVGTVYHEVFEAVWKMFSDEKEQNSVIQEFKDRQGSFIDRPTGANVKYSEATDYQIKEQLAEEFRDFVLNKKVPKKPKSGTPFIVKLFNDLVNFIKSFFTGEKAKNNTEKLFDKIGRGYYKQFLPQEQSLSFTNNGLIDVEQAFADHYSEFRIKNIPASDVHAIMEHMTYLTLRDLIKDNKSLFSIPKINKDELYLKLYQRFTKIAEKSGEWEELKKKHQEYLKTYSIEFDENDDTILKDEDASKKGDYQDATKIDVFKKANSAIKLLLSTIPMVDENNKLIKSSIGGVRLLPTSQVFMGLMNKLHTSRSLTEMMERLKKMSEEDNNYTTLYNRLTKNLPSLSEISEIHDSQLLTAFWRTFKKLNADVKNVYIFENGDVEVGDSNLSSAARQISNEYSNNIIKVVKGKNPYFEYSGKEKAYIGKPNSVRSIKLDNNQSRIAFLKSIGIEFQLNEINKLSSDKSEAFKEATAGIKKSIQEAEKIATISRKVLNIKGRLMQLSLIRASIDNPEFDSTFFNVKGERTQSFIGTNPVSDLFDVLSQIKNKRELVNTPYEYLLTDVFSQGSVILNKMFHSETGNRIKGGENLMHPGYADGTVNQENGKKKQSAKLTYKERLIQELNLNLKGYYYNLVPGDASMEWMVYMSNHISPSTLLSGYGELHKVFKGYFLSELELSRDNRPVTKKRNNKDLRFLKSILGEELQNKILKEQGEHEEVYAKYASQINKAVESFVNEESKKLNTLLSKYNIIKETEEGIEVENLAFSEGNTITEGVLKRNLDALSINFIINNIELHKLLYSDPYQYSDELKRIKNANSPRQSIINNSPDFNKALNKIWNKGYSKDDVGYTDMTRDYFTTVTLADVESTSNLKDYGVFEETDGGGIISQKAYRWFRIKAGEWNDDEEKQYKYDVAYEKDIKNITLSKEEQKVLENGNPEVKSAYTPLKPIVFGNKLTNKNYNDIVLDKFALYPLSFRIAHILNPESNAIRHYNKIQKENIDYTVFSTGRKVGSEGVNSLYNEDGSFNDSPYEALVSIPHSIISIQSEVPSKDEPLVTRGSQITKLATLDFMEAGVPTDFNKNKKYQDRYTEWYNLTEEQRLTKSSLYKEIKDNQKLLEAIIEQGYSTLLRRMGIEETKDGSFRINDITRVANTLEDEILKREVNDNIIDAFQGFKNGDVVLEATPAYQQIRNILYSIADKTVISPKISGGQKVQIPSTLLESVRPVGKNGVFESTDLSFYKDEDGKRVCEIMVGKWFKSELSDKELLKYLNTTKEGQSILAGIAYRIPTQKQNSIDSFVIKQFLPREFGDSVVIPSALVKKVGSDFDIDKLFIYFKNVYTDLKGNPQPIPFVGYGQEAKDKLAKMYEEGAFLNKKQRDIINKWIENRKEEEKQDTAITFSIAIFGEESYTQEVIDDYLDSISTKDLQNKIIDNVYKRSLENGYIQSLQNLVSHPLNFENLIKPNSAEQLKDLAKEITKKLGNIEFEYNNPGNMLSRGFMSRLRQAFVSGKYAIGIAAVNQTNHSLNQRQPIFIDNERWDLVSEEDKFWLSGGTMKKENVVIKFKNYNSLHIDNRSVPTLSMIKNSKGENISDIIGQFIDGYVDISKGPWIMELGATPNTASTWLFLVKLGVPIKDVAYFMNQPIIRDYLDSIENAGYSWLFIEDFVNNIKESPKYEIKILKREIIKEIPGNLVATVGQEKFDDIGKETQHFMLDEFLKYAKMANQSFLVTQGANWDTANFNDPYLVFKKNEQYIKAKSTIISSVDKLVDNSFIGKLSSTIYNVRDAFSTILTSDQPNIREVIENVLRPYVDLNDRDFVKLAQKAVNDLFDWAVQNDRKLNTQIQNILLSDENTANEMSDFVVEVRKNPNHPLYNNQVIKLITPHFSEQEGGVNNLKIKNKDNKVYDQNQMIYAFSELRQYLKANDSDLYGSLVRLAVLQSGLTNSPISFTSLLPYEDFKNIYNKTLSTLENYANLAEFNTLNVFERNNWNNNDIVPQRRAKMSKGDKYNTNMKFYQNRVSKAILAREIPPLVKINDKAGISDSDIIVYTWSVGSFKEQQAKKKIGDYSYIKKGLFKKIYKGNEPFELSYPIKNDEGENIIITDYVYKAINAWGDSHSSEGVYFSANEFYDVAKPSVIDNGFIRVENEFSDESILSYFEKPLKQTNKPEDSSNEEIPTCI